MKERGTDAGSRRPAGSFPGAGRSATLAQSFRHAWRGFLWIWQTEANMRLHLAAAVLLFATAWWLGVPAWQWAVLVLAAGLVVLLEWINTAIEGAVDLVTEEYRPLAGLIKDVAAGAVLVGALVATVTGLIVLAPELDRLPRVLLGMVRERPWALWPLLLALYLMASSARLRTGDGRRTPDSRRRCAPAMRDHPPAGREAGGPGEGDR